jgi:hypothetical protein
VLCIRAAYFVPLPGFAAVHSRAGKANLVDLVMPLDLGDLTGACSAPAALRLLCLHARRSRALWRVFAQWPPRA